MKKLITAMALASMIMTAFLILTESAWADRQSSSSANCLSSFSLENDLIFTDRNYTSGGLLLHSCSVSGSNGMTDPDGPWFLPLRAWNNSRLENAKDLFGVSAPDNRVYSHYGLLSLYTPNSLENPHPNKEDGRPYASLLIYGDSVLHANDSFAIKQDTQVGLMGLPVGGAIQDALHDAISADDPQGWSTEISRGGEPVIGFGFQGKGLLCSPDQYGSCGNGQYDVTVSLAGSLGYYTSVKAGFSVRMGKVRSPFWGDVGPINNKLVLNPLYNIQSAWMNNSPPYNNGPDNMHLPEELYFFVTGGADLVLYSAVLQGQIRENEYEVDSSDVERAVPYASLGMMFGFETCRVSFSHSFRGPEIRGGKSHSWTSISVGWLL